VRIGQLSKPAGLGGSRRRRTASRRTAVASWLLVCCSSMRDRPKLCGWQKPRPPSIWSRSPRSVAPSRASPRRAAKLASWRASQTGQRPRSRASARRISSKSRAGSLPGRPVTSTTDRRLASSCPTA
jgi:hypothetical protein